MQESTKVPLLAFHCTLIFAVSYRTALKDEYETSKSFYVDHLIACRLLRRHRLFWLYGRQSGNITDEQSCGSPVVSSLINRCTKFMQSCRSSISASCTCEINAGRLLSKRCIWSALYPKREKQFSLI